MIGHKLALALLGAACLVFPTMVQAQCTRCCGIQRFVTSLSVTPTTAEEGQPVSVTVGVSSCFSVARVFMATVNLTPTVSACTLFAEAFSVSGLIYPGGHRIFTYTLPAPKCDSVYNVKMNGTVGATLTVN